MIAFDPGSFKDPSGRVFYHDRWACRTLTSEARTHFDGARELIGTLASADLMLETDLVASSALGLDRAEVGDFVLRQPTVPLVTYAYEWSFEMLRDAALVTLAILQKALAAGFVLKDANSFNILFDGNVPKLVDTASLEPYREGTTWQGYGQFCRSFLAPLLLASYRDLDAHQLLLGVMGELPVDVAAKMLRPADYFKPGVLKDVVFQARLDRSFARSTRTVKQTTSQIQFPKASLLAMARRLEDIVSNLERPDTPSEWSDYSRSHSYSSDDHTTKIAFVTRALAERRFARIADLGCNAGEYSEAGVANGSFVIALDIDARAIDQLYRRVPRGSSLTPVVASLLKPTPAMGWGLRERGSLLDRVHADAFLALALIHHLRITGGIPLDRIVAQLMAIAPEGIVEWVDKQDSMVQAMLGLRQDVYDDYTQTNFEALLRAHAGIVATASTHEGRRQLYHVRRRAH
jgi:hypothetical protein